MDRTKKGSKKGWGRKVLLGSSPMGWSDEILGSVSTDDELENDVNAPENIGKESKCDPRPNSLQIPGPSSQTGFSNSLQIVEEPWHSGATLGRTPWDKSPSRSFVRNFP